MSKPRRQPCRVCGGEKLPGPGMVYCGPCREAQKSLVTRDQAARKAQRTAEAARSRGCSRQRAKDAPPGQFWCSRCARYLPRVVRAQGNKGSGWCRPCYSVYIHARRIGLVYGITPEQYEAMLEAQGNRCAICGNEPKRMRLAVDHNHHTGEVRGLLCKRCNRDVLGKADHNPELLRRAADYLDSPPSRAVLPEGHVVPGTAA